MSVWHRAAWAAYAGALEIGTWTALTPVAVWQQRRGVVPRTTLAERLGARTGRHSADDAPHMMIHAVSLGELAAARGLLHVLTPLVPGLRVTLTVGTRAARAVADGLLEAGTVHAVQFLPWDRAHAVRRWLAQVRPDVIVIVETELWPALLAEAQRAAIPVILVNARVYPNDVARYRAGKAVLGPVFGDLSLVAAKSPAERNRLIEIGMPPERTRVTGDLKAVDALCMAEATNESPGVVRECAGVRPLIVAGSTHEPEEHTILAAFEPVHSSVPEARLVLAPRASARAPAVVALAAARGLRSRLLADASGDEFDVLVVDRPGVLASFYPHATLAIAGGTFCRVGGHSLFEAAAAGVPTITGPSLAHIEDQVGAFHDAGAIIRAGRAEELAAAMLDLLCDSARRRTLGRRLRTVVEAAADDAARVAAPLAAMAVARRDSRTSASPREEDKVLTHSELECAHADAV
jgi:3-deoxy-D-manno-octulosonic-acid transferase